MNDTRAEKPVPIPPGVIDSSEDEKHSSPSEVNQDRTQLYLRDAARVPLLTAQDERNLGKQIEAGKYLSRLKEDFARQQGYWPSASDLSVSIGERLGHKDALLEALERQLGIDAEKSVAEKLQSQKLRQAVD